MELIAWAMLGEPGRARLIDGAELLQMEMVLDGEPFFDRAGLRSLMNKGLTAVHRDEVALAIAVMNSCLVEMAIEVGQGNLDGLDGLNHALSVTQEHLLDLVSYDGSPNAHAVATISWALIFNQLATAPYFDPAEHRTLLAGISKELSTIREDRARLERVRDASENVRQRRFVELDLELLIKTERDARLVRSAMGSYVPRAEQQSRRSAASSSGAGSGGSGGGCYVATAVYGSRDCAPVRTLRDWRDKRLATHAAGRAFIRVYYALSPVVVKRFGRRRWFVVPGRMLLDRLVSILRRRGYGAPCGLHGSDREIQPGRGV